MGMHRLRLDHRRAVTDRMEQLRRRCFLGDGASTSSLDDLDGRSSHVVVWLGEDPVAQIRITLDAPFAVAIWSGGAARVPSGPHVAELTRANVAPEFRGIGLSRLVFREALLRVAAAGKRVVVGAEEPELLASPMYRRLGYEPAGPEVVFREPIGVTLPVQPLVIADVAARAGGWAAEQAAEFGRLRAAGFLLDETGALTSEPDAARAANPALPQTAGS
jgi:GNAT superfamily N-acetyltransferase